MSDDKPIIGRIEQLNDQPRPLYGTTDAIVVHKADYEHQQQRIAALEAALQEIRDMPLVVELQALNRQSERIHMIAARALAESGGL